MARNRTATVVIGLSFVGAMLGAAAGIVTVAAVLFGHELRSGRLEWPFTVFGSLVGGLVGGGLGAILTPAIAFSPWRYVPIGRLFTHLTVGTVIGGCAGAAVVTDPVVAVLGGVVGFLVAGDRLATRANASTASELNEPRTPAG